MSATSVTAELLQRYDRPGPRYTSYPTAVEFSTDFAAREYAARVARLRPEEPVSLYLHLPFCARRCTFCGCNALVTRKPQAAVTYLEYLGRELRLLAAHLPAPLPVIQLHLGGGTPTFFTPGQLRWLHAEVARHFSVLPGAELAVEVDPRVTTTAHVDELLALGFNRLSMGVQDFTPAVQEAIGRNQEEAGTRDLYTYCRRQGFSAINIDLIYGLPRQTPATFARSVATVIALRPDRVALYSYAHVPWIKAHQRRMDTSALPRGMAKLELFAHAIQAFRDNGYTQIGMDHFALPEDELSQALGARRLHRNFMGYTVHQSATLIGMGITGIGDVGGAYAQNRKKLSAYYRDLDAGILPIQKGCVRSRDDEIRRYVITALMCNGYLRHADVAHRFGVDFGEYFALELDELRDGAAADGLLEISAQALEATDLGRLFIRNIAMVFDRYLRAGTGDRPAFSRTV